MIRKLIIDCDPGLDDALALITAAKIKTIDVLGITTVAGNACIENTSRNALDLVNQIGWNIPVIVGAAHPLHRDRILSREKTGLGEVKLNRSNKDFYNISAEDFIYNKALELGGELEILALGPMTNIAKTLLKYPDIKKHIKSITFMGGAIEKGNITEHSEFNIYVDSHAANIVFESGILLNMVTLDITKKSPVNKTYVDYFKELNTPDGELIANILAAIHTRECIYEENCIEVHDLVTLAVFLIPDLVKTRKFKINIEIKNKKNLGMLILDYRAISDVEKNINMTTDIDSAEFKKWFKAIHC